MPGLHAQQRSPDTTVRTLGVHMSSRFTAPYRRLCLPVVVALAITACQKKTEPAADAPAAAAGPTADTLEGQVDIVAWPGYIERGDTDKNYDWVSEIGRAS